MNASDSIWLTEYEGLLWSQTHRAESRRPCRADAAERPDQVTGSRLDPSILELGRPAPSAFLE